MSYLFNYCEANDMLSLNFYNEVHIELIKESLNSLRKLFSYKRSVKLIVNSSSCKYLFTNEELDNAINSISLFCKNKEYMKFAFVAITPKEQAYHYLLCNTLNRLENVDCKVFTHDYIALYWINSSFAKTKQLYFNYQDHITNPL